MKNHLTVVALCVMIGIQPVYAQQNGEEVEIRLNEEAVRMIRFDFSAGETPQYEELKPATQDKPWMEFKKDIGIPRSLIDTTRVKQAADYIRAEPYTIWTRFGEDPVYDVLVLGRPKKWEIHWKLNPYASSREEYGKSLPPSAGMMYERASGSLGSSISINNLDFIGFIYHTFTPRGRMLAHNRKHAKAWKIYKDYQPTHEDSLKFPTYYRMLPVYTPSDTDSIVRPASANKMENTSPPDSSANRFYEYIRQQKARDSIHRKEFLRKDKLRNNAYDVEKQIRSLKAN